MNLALYIWSENHSDYLTSQQPQLFKVAFSSQKLVRPKHKATLLSYQQYDGFSSWCLPKYSSLLPIFVYLAVPWLSIHSVAEMRTAVMKLHNQWTKLCIRIYTLVTDIHKWCLNALSSGNRPPCLACFSTLGLLKCQANNRINANFMLLWVYSLDYIHRQCGTNTQL